MPDAAVWEDIRLAYETTSETLNEIAARHGITRDKIYRHAKAEGWTLRPSGADALLIANAKRAAGIAGTPARQTKPATKKAKKPTRSTAPPPAVAEAEAAFPSDHSPIFAKLKRSGGTDTHQRAIIKRLYVVTDAKLTMIENRIASGKPLTATDNERESREIAGILKTIEKLKELSDAFARTNAKSGEPKPGTAAANAAAALADDADRLRQDLAERFARLKDGDENASPVE